MKPCTQISYLLNVERRSKQLEKILSRFGQINGYEYKNTCAPFLYCVCVNHVLFESSRCNWHRFSKKYCPFNFNEKMFRCRQIQPRYQPPAYMQDQMIYVWGFRQCKISFNRSQKLKYGFLFEFSILRWGHPQLIRIPPYLFRHDPTTSRVRSDRSEHRFFSSIELNTIEFFISEFLTFRLAIQIWHNCLRKWFRQGLLQWACWVIIK